MKKVVIDSSVYISFFSVDDDFSRKTKTFFQELSQHSIKLVHSSLMLAEVAVVLQKKKKQDVEEILQVLQKEQVVEVTKEFVEDFVQVVKNMNNLELKTSDCLIAFSARKVDGVLITWDKQLLKEGQKICQVMSPEEFVASLKEG